MDLTIKNVNFFWCCIDFWNLTITLKGCPQSLNGIIWSSDIILLHCTVFVISFMTKSKLVPTLLFMLWKQYNLLTGNILSSPFHLSHAQDVNIYLASNFQCIELSHIYSLTFLIPMKIYLAALDFLFLKDNISN